MDKEIGKKYGRLTVVEDTGKRYRGSIVYKCLCDCGNECLASTAGLTMGSKTSCGCRNKENQANIDNLRTGFVDGTSLTAIDGRRRVNKNNRSGHTGVCYDRSRKKWVAQLTFQRKNHVIGRFKYKREAITARKEAEQQYYGKYRKKENK